MATEAHVVQVGNGWFVETAMGRVGPMESLKEANTYLSLMQLAVAAGSEVACTEAECYT